MAVEIIDGKFYEENLDFWGWSGAEIDFLREKLATIYQNSSTARVLLDKIETVAPLTGVDITKLTVGSPYTDITLNRADVYLNLDYTNYTQNPKAKYIDKNGNTFVSTVERLMIHELIHAIEESVDPVISSDSTDTQDTYGAVVTKTNTIMNELGYSYERAGYAAAMRDSSEHFDVESFTYGNVVSQVIVIDQITKVGTGAVAANSGGNLILGSQLQDTIYGHIGNDYLYGGSGNDTITGGVGNDVLNGGNGEDSLGGGADDDILFGGGEKDTLAGGAGNDILHGGEDEVPFESDGTDTADYSAVNSGITVELSAPVNVPVPGLSGVSYGTTSLSVIDDGEGGVDRLLSIEKIIGTDHLDKVIVSSLDHSRSLEIDGRSEPASPGDLGDLIDASGLSSGITLTSDGQIEGTNIFLKNFEKFKGTSHKDEINGSSEMNEIDGGAGDDFISSKAINADIYGGAGNDTFGRVAAGTEITPGTGNDVIQISGGTRIVGADANDEITIADITLTGGIRQAYAESPYAMGLHGARYGLNTEGDLVIRFGHDIFQYVANYVGGPGVSSPTAGIQIAEVSITAHSFLEPLPFRWLDTTFEALDVIWKAYFGEPRWPGADPLVLDLDGDGLELTAQVNTSPVFDADGDGFGERTGWVLGDDGLLARDLNANGVIDDVSELFGNASEDGFTALSALDSNLDGVIDALDTDFADLRIWRDLDQDAETDVGELQTLTEAGITSIGLTTRAPTEPLNSQNVVTAVGDFTRSDGSTGEVSNVDFRIDNFNSVFLGDTTISAAAALLPEIKGHGVVADLRVAMTLDANLLSVVQATLPNLNVIDLDALRDAATPIFAAWGGAPAVLPNDVPALVRTGPDGATVAVDFGYYDATAGHWKLATGATVKDENDIVIPAPTYQDIIDSDPGTNEWRIFKGEQLAFMERYMGEPLPIGSVPLSAGSQALDAVGTFLDFAIERLDVLTVRLAMQGPLEPFFQDIAYVVDEDIFRADTARQLIPVYEAIFNATPADPVAATAYLENWKPILDVVIGDFSRGEAFLKTTYDFLFANVVAAHEAVGAPLGLIAASAALGIPQDLLVTGGAGVLAGTADTDIFYMNGGDQTARGGAGRDIYVFGKNFGTDVIDDVETPGQGHAPDLVRFADIASTEITATRIGDDFILTVDATGDQVTILRQFEGRDPDLFGNDVSDDTGVAEIAFADGVVWDRMDMAYALVNPQATSDTLIGTGEIDVLDGGAGDDRLEGGEETDIYRFGLGYGADVIYDGQTDLLIEGYDHVRFLDGIAFDDLILTRVGDSLDLVIGIEGTSDTLTIEKQFDSTYTGVFGQYWYDRIEIFTFSDGLSYFWDEILETILAEAKTDGNDTIYGFDYTDVLDGGAGDDYLAGGNENDTYIFGLGYGADTIEEGRDNIFSGGDDRVVFSAEINPADVVFSHVGDSDTLDISLVGDAATLTIVDQFMATYTGSYGTRWFDRVETFEFADGTVLSWDDVAGQILTEAKTSGDDVIYGFDRADTLDGGAGDDFLSGGNENDVYVFGHGYGSDTIDEQLGNILGGEFDIVSFTADVAVADVVLERGAEDQDLVIRLAGTSDVLTVKKTFRDAFIFSTLDYVEEYHFADGTIWTLEDVQLALLDIESTSGDDLIRGFRGDDTLDGGAGNDRLQGATGSDTYIFGTGYGQDVIYDASVYTGEDVNVVAFTSELVPGDIVLSRSGDDLVIGISGTTDTLTIEKQFDKLALSVRDNEIAGFHFADGTVWSVADVEAILLQSTAGDDVIVGFESDDLLDGGAGNDRLEGLGGDDTYVFDVGYGNDVIFEDLPHAFQSDFDVVTFGAGITPGDVTVMPVVDDLVLTVTSTGETLTIEDYSRYDWRKVEEFHFTDGTIWTETDIAALVDQATNGGTIIWGTEGDDSLSGTGADNIFLGRGGHDAITGGGGSDAYYYKSGDGNDTITESSGSGTDRLLLTDLNAADISFFRSRDNWRDLTLTVSATGETIEIPTQFLNGNWGIEEIAFADGTVWDKAQIHDASWFVGTSNAETITGSSFADTIVGEEGDDFLEGQDGGDTYRYTSGDGNDTIYELGTGTDTLVLTDLDPDDIAVSRLAGTQDVEIAVIPTGAAILITSQAYGGGRGIENVEFADGTVWDKPTLLANAVFVGTPGNDFISGTAGDDIIIGNGGDDTIYGGGGSDTYHYASGDGNDSVYEYDPSGTDRLVLTDLNVSDLMFTRKLSNKRDLEIAVIATGEAIFVDDQFDAAKDGFEEIEFSDGTIWDRAAIFSSAWMRGTESGESIYADEATDDVIVGNGGDDTLYGGGGNDTYIYASGDGNDLIDERTGAGTDRLVFTDLDIADLTFARTSSDKKDLAIAIDATGETITVDEQFDGLDEGVEEIEFADGTVWDRATIQANAWIRGTTGNDTVTGSSDDDTIYGNAGDDTLSGAAGSDTFVFKSGEGSDTITGFTAGAASDDVIELMQISGFTQYSDVTAAASEVSGDTIIDLGAGHDITLSGVNLASLHEDDFRFV